MRTTVTIDDELLKRAHNLTGIKERSVLIRTALEDFVAKEAARRLILLGGTEPDLKAPPRRRFGG
jgi:metal-responsive CopG/Arc/MetJ family transcriptional regulator